MSCTDLVPLADATVAPPPVGTVVHGECWVCFTPASVTVTPNVLKSFRVPTIYCGPVCRDLGKERRRTSWIASRGVSERRDRVLSENPLRGPRVAPDGAVWVAGACACGSLWTKPVTDAADVPWVSSFCSPGCHKRSQEAERAALRQERVSRVERMAQAAREASKAFSAGRVTVADAGCTARPDKIAYMFTPAGFAAAERARVALRARTGSVAPEVYLCDGAPDSSKAHYHVGNWGPTALREIQSRTAS